MADIDRIVDFDGKWKQMLASLKPGDVLCNIRSSKSDGSIERAEAVVLYRRFGALRDDEMGLSSWALDWRDGSAPQVRLSPDLFEHVDQR